MKCFDTDFGQLCNDPATLVSQIYKYGLGLIGGVALLFIIYGGYLILSSQGEPEKVKTGRSYIVYSIVGLLLALGGFVFYQVVAQNILGIPGFK